MRSFLLAILLGGALASGAWGLAWLRTAPLQAPDAGVRMAAQREALEPFAAMDGEWRGAAWTLLPDGSKHEVTQTERVGPFLDGTVRVIEGRGYAADGTVAFNALGVLFLDPDQKALRMRSWTAGRTGEFPVTRTGTGFSWEMPAGPMTIRYTATVEADSWHEVGHRIAPGREPQLFFEMTLRRIGDSKWPAGGAIGAK